MIVLVHKGERTKMASRNGKLSHGDALRPALQDEIALALALQERFVGLCGSYLRIKGEELPIPDGLNKDFLRWRCMMVRHRKGDFRCTDSEVKSIHSICQWTVDVNCAIRNQPITKIDWGTS